MTRLSDSITFEHGAAWRNRLALAPLTNVQSHDDGTLGDDEIAWLVARGRGGFAQVMTAAAYVSRAGRAWQGQLGVAGEEHLPGLRRLADGIRATGAASAVQLHHGGMRAAGSLNGGENLGPWAQPDKHTAAMSTAQVRAAVAEFVDGAVLAERAGFDGVQVHGAHGYLIGQFLDPRGNHREDGYGGDLAGRSRMLTEILTGIREATGPDFWVGLRLTPEGYGIELTEGVATARRVLDSGLVDALDMSLWNVRMAPRRDDTVARIIDPFVALERGATRLGVTGTVLGSEDARWCLATGADYVGVGIGAILHHDFAARALAEDGFVVRERPLTRAELAAEFVGPAFVDYLAEGWDDMVR